MKIIGYPTEWNEEEGLLPIEIQDIQIYANEKELKQIAALFDQSAKEYKINNKQSLELKDSKTNPKTGINIMVVSSEG